MNWEIMGTGGTAGEPMPELKVTAAIRSGALPATTQARPAGKDTWRPIGAHGPFAEALAGRARDLEEKAPSRSREQFLGVLAALFVLGLCAGGWFIVGGHIVFAKEGAGIVLSLP